MKIIIMIYLKKIISKKILNIDKNMFRIYLKLYSFAFFSFFELKNYDSSFLQNDFMYIMCLNRSNII